MTEDISGLYVSPCPVWMGVEEDLYMDGVAICQWDWLENHSILLPLNLVIALVERAIFSN